VLGESWEEASEKMIERTPPPEARLPFTGRKRSNQPRLFDTEEMEIGPASVTVPPEKG
jgi:hypothetical protein